ncbi:MAG: hypothetical protein ACAI43_26345 [Phycisphaerae bacterium]
MWPSRFMRLTGPTMPKCPPTTSVDRARRDIAAGALAAYLRSEIDNFALDDVLMCPATLGPANPDAGLREVARHVWHYYDDVKRHTVRCPPLAWDVLVRCVAFLRTDRLVPRWRESADDEVAEHFMPFESAGDWDAHRHLVDADQLPAYDPAVHGKRINKDFAGWGLAMLAAGAISLAVWLAC